MRPIASLVLLRMVPALAALATTVACAGADEGDSAATNPSLTAMGSATPPPSSTGTLAGPSPSGGATGSANPPAATSAVPPVGSETGGAGFGGAGSGSGGSVDDLLDFAIPTLENDEQCGFCHGSQGEGTVLGPEIQHPVEDFATWVVRNGREHPDYELEMPAFSEADVSQEFLQEIFDFLSAFPQPTTGQALFLDYCANCHGADALGGVPDRPIIDAPEDEFLELVRSGHSPGEFGDRREFMPKFSQDQVSDAELTLIIEYVGSL